MIPHNRPSISQQEQQAVSEVINSGFLAYRGGTQVQALEQELCDFLGLPSRQVLLVNSGSVALFLALKFLAKPESTVSLPSYTCHSLKQACQLNQLETQIEDVQEHSVWAKTSASNASVSILPYTFGFACIPKTKHGLLIEDISQALGAKANRQSLGLYGDLGVCSFSATKMMTTGGQGGMIFSTNRSLIDEIRQFIDFDDASSNKQAFNFNLTEMQAAFGREQLKRLPSFIQKRADIWEIYKDHNLPLWDCSEAGTQPVRFRAIIKVNHAQNIQHKLEAKGIKSIIPITRSELLKDTNNARNLTLFRLSLPIYPSLTIKDAIKIAKTTKELL